MTRPRLRPPLRPRPEPAPIFKIMFSGPEGSGKSALLSKIKKDTFTGTYDPTISVGLYTIDISGQDSDKNLCKLQIWDTAGSKTYEAITGTYYGGASAACFFIALDATPDQGGVLPDKLRATIAAAKALMSPGVPLFLIPTKSDLVGTRKISDEALKVFARENELTLLPSTSAKAESQEALCQKICNPIVNALVAEPKRRESASTSPLAPPKKSEKRVPPPTTLAQLEGKIQTLLNRLEIAKNAHQPFPPEVVEYISSLYEETTGHNGEFSLHNTSYSKVIESGVAIAEISSAHLPRIKTFYDAALAAEKVLDNCNIGYATGIPPNASLADKKTFSKNLNLLLDASAACDTGSQKWLRRGIMFVCGVIGAVAGAFVGTVVSLALGGSDYGASAVVGAVKGGLIGISAVSAVGVYGGAAVGAGIIESFLYGLAKRLSGTSPTMDPKKVSHSKFYSETHRAAARLRQAYPEKDLVPSEIGGSVRKLLAAYQI